MEKKQFQAESKRLLDLMINSIYTHREIFLRELISNASDAIDKLAYQALTDDTVGLSRSDFAIHLATDEGARTLTVSDNGIGMTREEMEENLGTIAHSGSLRFKKEMEKSDDIDIIGQFGVGFYAAFMVAEKVTVISRRFGSDEAWKWESEGADGYTMDAVRARSRRFRRHPDAQGRHGRGQVFRLSVRISPCAALSASIPTTSAIRSAWSEIARQKARERAEGAARSRSMRPSREEQTLNSMMPDLAEAPKRMSRRRSTTTSITKNSSTTKSPLSVLHFGVEGAVTYKALLYIPAKAPYDFYTRDYKSRSAALFLRRAHHGKLRRPAAGALPLRPRRGRHAGPEPEHQPRDAAAHERAEGHRRQPRKEDQGRAGAHAEGRP